MMTRFLLDTNQLIEAIRTVSRVRDRLPRERIAGAKIGTCVPVLCELEAGIQQRERSRRILRQVLADIRIWPIDVDTAKHYGAIYAELRAEGRVLSQVDMMLAALARQMRCTLLTSDRDFEALPDLRIDDWTQPPPNTPGSPA